MKIKFKKFFFDTFLFSSSTLLSLHPGVSVLDNAGCRGGELR